MVGPDHAEGSYRSSLIWAYTVCKGFVNRSMVLKEVDLS